MCFYKVRGCATIIHKESLEVDDLKECSEVVHAALLELDKLYGAIRKGAVTGKEVESYRKQANELQALYEAASIGSAQLVPCFADIDLALEVCIAKLAKVKEYRMNLVAVVDYCKHISKGL